MVLFKSVLMGIFLTLALCGAAIILTSLEAIIGTSATLLLLVFLLITSVAYMIIKHDS